MAELFLFGTASYVIPGVKWIDHAIFSPKSVLVIDIVTFGGAPLANSPTSLAPSSMLKISSSNYWAF